MKVDFPNLVDGNEILFTMDWIMKYPSGTLKFGRAHYDPRDLRTVVEYIDGVGFMKSMVTFFEQRHILNYQGPHLGSSYAASNGKRMYMKFRWDGDDLFTRLVCHFTRSFVSVILSRFFVRMNTFLCFYRAISNNRKF